VTESPAVGNEVVTRILSGIVFAAVALSGALLGGVFAGFLIAFGAAIVSSEWGRMIGDPPRLALAVALAVAAAVVFASTSGGVWAFGLAAAVAIGAALLGDGIWRPAGVSYAAAFGLCLVELRMPDDMGLAAFTYVLVLTWATDSGAFFFGRFFGGPKLWPRVSPKKTWSGAVGGLVAGVAGGVVFLWLAEIPLTPAIMAVTILLAAGCQAGDLFESLVKRRFRVKDSGTIIPGHGGLMDRVDGLTVVAAVAAVIGLVHGGPTQLARGLLIW